MTIAKAKAPKQVGRYQLAYEVATSYLGPLWVARIEGNDAGLAILRLVSLSRLDADTRVRLLEAAWQAMEVRDQRVASASDVVASDGELCVVSEYVEGIPLRGFSGLVSVRRKPIPVAVALRFIVDLADGVVALHHAMAELGDEAVPLYGGLSTDSVLIGADGRASIIDVAIASAASTVESLGASPERLAYASPEQVGPGGAADRRSDVFSLGVIAWELLSNRRLFAGADKAVGQKVLTAKIPRLDEGPRKGESDIPKPLADAVMRALERDPAARFESAEAFRAALQDVKLSPAPPEEASNYVISIADGAFARVREALSLPPRPRPEVSVANPARGRPAPQTSVAGRSTGSLSPADASTPRAVPVKPAAVRTGAGSLPAAGRAATTPAGARPAPSPPAEPPRTAVSVTPSRIIDAGSEPAVSAPGTPSRSPQAGTATPPKPSVNPSPGLGWRALEPPAGPRSVPPAKVRPRQMTMIGLPPPADSRSAQSKAPPAPAAAVGVAATVPVVAPTAVVAAALGGVATPVAPAPVVASAPAPTAPVTEPPPSSDGSDEPTAQYSREHLRQLAATPSEAPVAAAPRTDTATERVRAPARESQAPLSRLAPHQPTPRPLSEIHTERPPPPEPEAEPAPPFRVAAPLPPADLDAPEARVAAAPLPARLDPPPAVDLAASSIAPPRGERGSPARRAESAAPPAGGRAHERPAFSRPPPATAPASYLPSQIAPPLVHDPRANRMPSLRPVHGLHFTRGVVLGVVVSLCLVVVSTVVALFVMRRSAPESNEEPHTAAAGLERPAAPIRTQTAALPAPVTSVAAAVSGVPEVVPAEPLAAASAAPSAPVAADEPTEAAPVAAAVSATAEPAPAIGTLRAPAPAAPRAPRSGHKATKKHPRFVPSDI